LPCAFAGDDRWFMPGSRDCVRDGIHGVCGESIASSSECGRWCKPDGLGSGLWPLPRSDGGGGGDGCIMPPPAVGGAECGAGEYGGELRLWPGGWMVRPAAAAADCAE
jgi:hypothetical protein